MHQLQVQQQPPCALRQSIYAAIYPLCTQLTNMTAVCHAPFSSLSKRSTSIHTKSRFAVFQLLHLTFHRSRLAIKLMLVCFCRGEGTGGVYWQLPLEEEVATWDGSRSKWSATCLPACLAQCDFAILLHTENDTSYG